EGSEWDERHGRQSREGSGDRGGGRGIQNRVACARVPALSKRFRLLPAHQLRNFTGQKNCGEKSRHPELDDLVADARLHFRHRNIRQNELSVLITMTAVHCALGSVSVRATTFFIPFHRHPATLAILDRKS